MSTLVGIDIGGTTVKLALVRAGAQHQILKTAKVDTGADEPGEKIVGRIADAVRKMSAESGEKPVGVGAGCPGLINDKTGIVVTSANLPTLKNFPLAGELSKQIGLPAHVPVTAANRLRRRAARSWSRRSAAIAARTALRASSNRPAASCSSPSIERHADSRSGTSLSAASRAAGSRAARTAPAPPSTAVTRATARRSPASWRLGRAVPTSLLAAASASPRASSIRPRSTSAAIHSAVRAAAR